MRLQQLSCCFMWGVFWKCMNCLTFITLTQSSQTSQATVWLHLMSPFCRPYTCLKLCSEDFSFFCLLSSHQNLSHMVGQNPDNTVCAAVVWSFDTFVNNVWASSFHWAGVVSVLIFSVVVDMSRSLWPAYLLPQREVKEAFRRSPLRSPHLHFPQKWCQDNRGRGVCTASHQLWKLRAILCPDFCYSPTHLISSSHTLPSLPLLVF